MMFWKTGLLFALILMGPSSELFATVPQQISHQGVVTVNGQRFTGNGATFYFALVSNGGTGVNLWTNDGTNIGNSNRPIDGVPGIPIVDGVYNANLGGGTMTPIEPAVFNNANVVLRIWFDDGVNGEQQLKPDQPLVSAPYTMESERVGGWLAKELVPPGTIVAFGGASAPPGWLLCDGSEIPRAAYAGLFDAVGTNWGGGDGIATFHLPDLRGRFLRGRDGGSGRDPDVESRTPANIVGSSGDAVGSVQGDAFQGHRHGLNHSNLSATEWNGGNNGFVDWTPGNTTTHRFWNDWRVMGALTDPSYGTVRITSETRPINAYVNYIIKY